MNNESTTSSPTFILDQVSFDAKGTRLLAQPANRAIGFSPAARNNGKLLKFNVTLEAWPVDADPTAIEIALDGLLSGDFLRRLEESNGSEE